ncbi:MAG: NIPSNAP family protein, partial [Gemmataceae bacterium]
MNRWITGLIALGALTIGLPLGVWAEKEKKMESKVYEMRTYYAEPGKMKELHARFRNHTCKLFQKHGMELVGFWSPRDAKEAEQKMVYIVAHKSKEAAEKSWAAFRADPEWIAARDASEKNGKLVQRIEVL